MQTIWLANTHEEILAKSICEINVGTKKTWDIQ